MYRTSRSNGKNIYAYYRCRRAATSLARTIRRRLPLSGARSESIRAEYDRGEYRYHGDEKDY